METINFSRFTLDELKEYFDSLDGESAMLVEGWLQRLNMESLNPMQMGFHIAKIRNVAVRAEIWEEYGLTLEEFMAERFGGDWEEQLRKPRGSQSVSKGRDKIAAAINKALDAAEDFTTQRMVVDRSKSYGVPVLSIRPLRQSGNPCSKKFEDGELELHSPQVGSIECGAMIREVFLTPIVTVLSGGMVIEDDITGGGARKEIVIVGFTEYYKSRRCGKVGHIGWEVPTGDGQVVWEIHNVPEEQSWMAEGLASLEMDGANSEELADWFSEFTRNSGLYRYYKVFHPNQDAWKSVMKAYSGGTLKMKYSPSLDFTKIAERRLKFAQDAIDNKIRQLAGMGRMTSAERLAGVLPEIDWETRQLFEQEAVKVLTRNYLMKIRRDHKALQNPTHGRLRSKQTKMRNGDKSCTVNGVRSVQLDNQFALIRFIVDGKVQYQEPVNRSGLEELLSEIGFNWEGYARKKIAEGAFKPNWTAADVAGQINTGLTRKDNREQLAELMLTRMVEFSLENMLRMKSPYVRLSNGNSSTGEIWYSDAMEIQFRHVYTDSEEFAKLQEAAKLVEDAGEELTYKTVMSAYKKPGPWQKLAAEVKGSIMTQAVKRARKGYGR